MRYRIGKPDGGWSHPGPFQPFGVSTTMRRALRSLLRNDPKATVGKSTLKALEVRGLVSPSGELTENGTLYAVSLCPLREQAKGLGIPLTEQRINRRHDRPEFDLLDQFRQQGAMGCFTEGGVVFVLLYSIWFDTLMDCKRRKWSAEVQLHVDMMYDGRYNVFSYVSFVDLFPAIQDSLLEAIDNTTTAQVIENYRKIERLQFSDTWWPYGYYGITEELVSSLFDILGRERLRSVATVFLQDCLLYKTGWPDLLVIEDGVARFIEVKTTDKLHISQIILMTEMMAAAQLEIEIVKIVDANRRPSRRQRQRAAIVTALQDLQRVLTSGPQESFEGGVYFVANDPKCENDPRRARAVAFRLAAERVQDALLSVGPASSAPAKLRALDAPAELRPAWGILNVDLHDLDYLPASKTTLRTLQTLIEDLGGSAHSTS